MGAGKIYFKTMKFMWMKLGLGMITVGISALWLGILAAIGKMFQVRDLGIVVLVILWAVGTEAVNSLLNHYVGYLVKAGHVAIIATAAATGQVPDRQVAVAKDMVKGRFATSNVYFVVDKLVSKSVREIQGVLQKADGLLGNLPGMETIVSILQLFVKIALDYVDECCLGYTFLKKDESAFKSAADGVVLYVQNWKALLKNAAFTTGMVILLTLLAWILPFLLLGAVFAALSLPRWIAAIIALLVAYCVKYAFVDSYMMIRMMTGYMQEAQHTQITYDLYGKLCSWSSQFKELFDKAKEEGGRFVYGESNRQPYAEAPYQPQQPYAEAPYQPQQSFMNAPFTQGQMDNTYQQNPLAGAQYGAPAYAAQPERYQNPYRQ